TTHEVGISPSFPSFSPVIRSVVFFIITLTLTIRPNRVVDIVGNILTPVLLILLICLIALGIWAPIDAYGQTTLNTGESFTLGFVEGYQTLDVLASVRSEEHTSELQSRE